MAALVLGVNKQLIAYTMAALLLAGSGVKAAPLKIPLMYHSNYGVYTAPLRLSGNTDPLQAIVDTGSANFIVRGDEAVCQGCQSYITQSSLTINQKKLDQHPKHIRYGSADMTFKPYADQLQVGGARSIATQFAVATSGRHVSNIWGLAYQSLAAPADNPLPVLFDTLRNELKLADQFGLSLCGQEGDSYLMLYDERTPIDTPLKTPIINKLFYSVAFTGVKVGRKHLIHYQPSHYQVAMLDSGTGGMIIMPAKEQKAIIQAIYKQTSQSNQKLPASFWHKNYCVPTKYINYKTLPIIKLGFAKAGNNKQSIYLALPPDRYISGGGCKKGSARLAFVGHPDYKSKHVKQHPHKQALLSRMPQIIIGTPLFEQYDVIFQRSNPAEVSFAPSRCGDKGAKRRSW